MDERTRAYYESHGHERSKLWESIESPLASLLPMVFGAGQQVLDVGCGSGRDCALLLELGVHAWGLEPVAELRAVARERHPELAERLIAESVHDHSASHAEVYDGLLLSAVLQHVPDHELFDLVVDLRRLLKPGGAVVISVPTEHGDVDGATGRDRLGRLFVLRGEAQVMLLFERLGFRLEARYERNDSLQRDATWLTLVFRFAQHEGERHAPRAIDRIESIINRDRKTATYKLALLRALAEVATNSPSLAEPVSPWEVRIPLDEVALLWVGYYWPLVAGERPLPQNWNGKGPVRFESELRALIAAYEPLDARAALAAYNWHARTGGLPDGVRQLHQAALREIRTALRTGPIRYAGANEFRHAGAYLYVQADLWREFVLMGHWIADSVILRWAELTAAMVGWISVGEVVAALVTTVESRRQDQSVRTFYAERVRGGGLISAWSDRRLHAEFDVDHIIPFALRRDSSMWNLVPATSRENNAKRDRLPTLELVRRSQDRIVTHWRALHEWEPQRFRSDAVRLHPTLHWDNWELTLVKALEEAVETTATIRGSERWAGG